MQEKTVMGFEPITINKYIKLIADDDPNENPKELRRNLEYALAYAQSGRKCKCGNDIWVLGSAYTGCSCFTCITGKSSPASDFEIVDVLPEKKYQMYLKEIEEDEEMEKNEIVDIFDDDVNEITPD
jgi:hypothetical protein